ncbi:glycosyltransferase family 2 protein [Enterococcus mundtii]|uniref:glycosyltransferase family 2 protein n=1 Tax=Enterococcus mundtii TaxID=53346 RepID=UPI00189AFC23|nr:glycosyltransferase family 2 protein [Enterococcus mundtii]MDB7100868.1 glycosyltransferase family 2 protein [Enterococcus mundtii]
MKINSVAIILSSYNGENYISEQIESIIKQTYKEWKLFIRDDGSTDSTVSIINRYVKEDDRIQIIKDNYGNLGPLKSFELLMDQVIQFEYIFFCDQDDIWLEKKIEISLNEMSQMNNNVKLVYTNFEKFETGTNIKEEVYKKDMGSNHKNLLVQNWIYGCTMVINNELLKLTRQIPVEAINHDNWIVNVAQIYGEISYINEIMLLHRLHDNNVTTRKENKILRKLRYMLKIIKERNTNKRKKRIFVEKIMEINKEIPKERSYIKFFYGMLISKNPIKVISLYKENFRGYTVLRTVSFYFTIL